MYGEGTQLIKCPYCFQTIELIIDLSIQHQTYIEDCEVCCRPIEIVADSNLENEETIVDVKKAEG